ncbi:MAG TPA: hypothetical protein PLW68_03625 [Casimicrobiaceae bacterium]|nr:hypothetical protein [Casimicrobiaceae bacterium]
MSAQLTLKYLPSPARNSLSAGASAVAAIALAFVLVVGLVIADARVDGSVTPASTAPQPVIGTFAGTYQDGLPVYRLPSMEITAPRDKQ